MRNQEWRKLYVKLNDADRKLCLIRAGESPEAAEEWLDDPNAMPKVLWEKFYRNALSLLASRGK